ncbi:MAG: BatD family protein [Ketobacteraceae bacterium]|nr:BatD family protein [Ketobacteraceae bacterium]
MKQAINFIFSTIILVAALATPAWAVEITASVDAHKLEQGDSLVLTVEVNELAMGKKPDFSVLEDQFDILSTTTQQRTRIINDQMESSMTWNLTLVPKANGYIVIPPITYDNAQSRPITIQVAKRTSSNKHSSNNLVFIEASVDKQSVYVQEQVILTLRLYRRTQIIDPSWTPPEIENAVMEKLTDSRAFQTTIDGHTYHVTENTLAVFPQKSGTMVIPESRLTGVIGTGRRSGFFDPFSSAGTQIQRTTKRIEVAVKPIPDAYPNRPWLPSKSVGLADHWTPENAEFQVGEAVTRTIILQAKGITATALPTIPVPNSDKFKVYPDKADTQSSVDADGMVSQRVESYAFIPTEPGTVTLPEIQVSWWDVTRDELKTATLPAKTIKVKGSATVQRTDQSVSAPPSTSPAPASAPPSMTNGSTTVSATWQWIAVVSTVLWLITLVALVLVTRRRKAAGKPDGEEPQAPRIDIKDAKNALKKACQEDDPKAAKQALIDWGNAMFPQSGCHSLGDVARQVSSEKCRSAIKELEILLYRKAADGDWDGTYLWEAAEEVEQEQSEKAGNPALAPLYPG